MLPKEEMKRRTMLAAETSAYHAGKSANAAVLERLSSHLFSLLNRILLTILKPQPLPKLLLKDLTDLKKDSEGHSEALKAKAEADEKQLEKVEARLEEVLVCEQVMGNSRTLQ